MTGVEVKALFNTYLDEVGSGYIDDARLNNLFFKADNLLVKKCTDEYGLTQTITDEMLPLILNTNPITPVAQVIDISPTSAVVPFYYTPILTRITAPYLTYSLTNVAKERPYDQFTSNYTKGTARYPRYYLRAGQMVVEPANATSVLLTYFRTAILIDVADNTIQVPYNNEYVLELTSWVIDMAGFMGRDQFLMLASQTDKQRAR